MYAVGFAAASRRSLFFSDYRLELSNDNDFMPLIIGIWCNSLMLINCSPRQKVP